MQKTELKAVYSNQKGFYKKAYIETNSYGEKTLLSYGTPILTIDESGSIIGFTQNENHLSNTTLKHVKEFMLQNGLESMPKRKLITEFIK